jgi:tetratricopeptide (TPR) repeat protein
MTRIVSLFGIFAMVSAPSLFAQKGSRGTGTRIEGTIQDSQSAPIAGVLVSLDPGDPAHRLFATADAQGRFRFDGVPLGQYTLHASVVGYQDGSEGPFALHLHEIKSITLVLTKLPAPPKVNDPANLEFKDEPAFTVAGVTDTTALGGHGSDRVLPSSNALAKDAASLAQGSNGQVRAAGDDSEEEGVTSEASLRAELAIKDTADLRAQLAEIEEREGRPLEAVKDYQRAAEMQPNEPHLFSWGAELLLHHAFVPAIEVFMKGRSLYPQSSRMLLGLGSAQFAEGSKEEAERNFLAACDVDPRDPTPYLFLGRLQAIENIEPAGWTERMARFASLHPENAQAHHLYAVALSKQDRSQKNLQTTEAELKSAIALDPHFGDAYLQLGILRAEREDFPAAIAAFQKAIENTPLPDEAHYRLAQIYRRTGNTEMAGNEIALYKQVLEQKNKGAERERHEIQQFVYTLRGQNAPSQTPASKPQ